MAWNSIWESSPVIQQRRLQATVQFNDSPQESRLVLWLTFARGFAEKSGCVYLSASFVSCFGVGGLNHVSETPAGEGWVLKREGRKGGQQQNNLPVYFSRSPSGLAAVVCISNDSTEMITLPQRVAGRGMALHYVAHYYSLC